MREPLCSWDKWRLFPPTWDEYFHTLRLCISLLFTLSPIVMKDQPLPSKRSFEAFTRWRFDTFDCISFHVFPFKHTFQTEWHVEMFKSFTCQTKQTTKKKNNNNNSNNNNKHQKTFGIWSGPVGLFFCHLHLPPNVRSKMHWAAFGNLLKRAQSNRNSPNAEQKKAFNLRYNFILCGCWEGSA